MHRTATASMRPGGISHLSLLCLSLLSMLALMLFLVRVYPYPWTFPALPRITHTASGAAGDPLNLVLVGTQQQIAQSFHHAGWLVPDPITLTSSEEIAADSVAHRPYPTAPVSNLYVFGRAQDLAFERSTNDVQNRGHVRLWRAGTVLSGQPIWIGQASYDHGIELSGTTGLPTHHIAPVVDLQRNAVGADLARTGLVVHELAVPFTAPIFAAHNGGGDFYASDGDALVITFTHTSLHLTTPNGILEIMLGLKRVVFLFYDMLLTDLLVAIATCGLGIVVITVGMWPALRGLVQSRGADTTSGRR